MAGADQYDEMMQALRTLEVPFQSSVKDLRSQVDYYIITFDLILEHRSGIIILTDTTKAYNNITSTGGS